jgi:hypothetical protein
MGSLYFIHKKLYISKKIKKNYNIKKNYIHIHEILMIEFKSTI